MSVEKFGPFYKGPEDEVEEYLNRGHGWMVLLALVAIVAFVLHMCGQCGCTSAHADGIGDLVASATPTTISESHRRPEKTRTFVEEPTVAPTFEPTAEPTAEPAEPTERLTAGLTAETTEVPAFVVQGYNVYRTQMGYYIQIQGEMYPLGKEVEGLRLEKGIAISVVEGEKITSVIIPQIKMQIGCIAVVSFGNRIIIQETETKMWLYDGGTIYSYEGKPIKLIDLYSCYLDGKEVDIIDGIPWKQE